MQIESLFEALLAVDEVRDAVRARSQKGDLERMHLQLAVADHLARVQVTNLLRENPGEERRRGEHVRRRLGAHAAEHDRARELAFQRRMHHVALGHDHDRLHARGRHSDVVGQGLYGRRFVRQARSDGGPERGLVLALLSGNR